MKGVNVYLCFPGTAEEAFTLYRSAFGGEFAVLQRYADGPMAEQVPAAERQRILHVALPLPGGCVLMGTDHASCTPGTLTAGNQVQITIETASEAETTALWERLRQGGSGAMPPQRMFWGAFYASCVDRFGVPWMLNYTYPA